MERRIKKSVGKVRKHINILERDQRGEIRRTEKGIRTVIEELKQRLHAKTAKLKRCEERVNQYKINRMFAQNH